MEINEINSIALRLKDNPIFNMSLGSKELFHSNFLSWLFIENEEFRKLFFNRIKNHKNHEHIDIINKNIINNTYSSSREEGNVDFQIIFGNSKKTDLRVLIENKFKSIPNKEQLEKYSKKIKSKKICFLLSPQEPKFLSELTEWDYISYNDLLDILNKVNNFKYKHYLIDYINCLKYLLELFKIIKIESNTTIGSFYTESNNYKILQSIKLHDLYHKNIYSNILVDLLENIKESSKLGSNIDSRWHFSTYYSKCQGAVGGGLIIEDFSKKHEIRSQLSFQFQNDVLKLYISHPNCKKIITDNSKNYSFLTFIEKYFSFFENKINVYYKKEGKKGTNGIYPKQNKNLDILKSMNQYSKIHYYRNVYLKPEVDIDTLINCIIKPLIKHIECFAKEWEDTTNTYDSNG